MNKKQSPTISFTSTLPRNLQRVANLTDTALDILVQLLFLRSKASSSAVFGLPGVLSVYFSAHRMAARDARLSMKNPVMRGKTVPL